MAALSSYILSLFSVYTNIAAYTLSPSESLTDGQTLISQGGTFQLGFFRPSATSNHRYLGIWYNTHTIPVQTVVWVANRESPLNDTSGVLQISSSGNLVIVHSQTETVIWSSNTTKAVENPIVEFLDSGNLVLRDPRYNDSKSCLWQSFDYQSNTLLPGMKQGWNLRTGINRRLTSWKSFDDPSPGDYTYGLELGRSPEFIVRKGVDIYYRGGSWNGLQASGTPELEPNPLFTYEFVDNDEEKYFRYQLPDHLNFVRLVLTQTSSQGIFQLLSWVKKTNSWLLQFSIPRDHCDKYALCGAYGVCDVGNIEVCQCLEGFKPKSPGDWARFDWSLGCQRQESIKCSQDEGFKIYTGVNLPDTTTASWTNRSMTLDECRVKCLNNCSCMAYANSDITDGGRGCILWYSDLVDMRKLTGTKQDLYIRMASSELANSGTEESAMLIVAITLPLVVVVIAFGLGSFYIWKRRIPKGNNMKDDLELLLCSKRDDLELPLFDLATIISATNNFSTENKLGEGGFGAVYKGRLDGGEEIAVKRLSNNSMQGATEFKNEVILISKLQHRNLVKILGCCIQSMEKMLIYEYMQNNSLDSYIFDETKSRLLDWEKRSQIILGIARGLLYLHHDSRLRIIHRDLKASNVLLDGDMVAKISDFGIARILHGEDMEAKTRKVIGTRGYMSPEYAVEGYFSVKSDVFSFGVLVLEIISGKRNKAFSDPDHWLNLLGHDWRLWNENKPMELVDKSMDSSSFMGDISRYIHIGLLCVQKVTNQRPTMHSVVLMLSSENVALPQPQPPGFYIERSTITEEYSSEKDPSYSNNQVTITTLQVR